MTSARHNLIRFDLKSSLFVALLVSIFLLFTAFGLHGSSIPIWDEFIPGRAPAHRGWVLLEPKAIRADEWHVATPFAFSQYQRGFPPRNPSLGAHTDPLLNMLPARHWSTFFKPPVWGYFFLGQERGFAFYWNFKAMGLALSSFLLLMMLTKNRFWLSAAGAFWIYFSSFIQWFFSVTLPEMITAFNVVFVALILILLSPSRRTVAASAALLFLFGFNFLLFFYPPFQLPLAWLLAALLAGFLWQKEYRSLLRVNFTARGALLIIIGGAIAIMLFLFYNDARETVEAIANTVYPGNRRSNGGEIDLLRLFSGFTLSPLSEKTFPAMWGNASEASNFIMLFPVAMAASALAILKSRRPNPLIVTLSAYLIAMTAYMVLGFPTLLAKVTLMNLATSNRVMLGAGMASILMVIVYLAESKQNHESETFRLSKDDLLALTINKRDYSLAAIAALAMGLLLAFLAYRCKTVAPDYFRLRYLVLMVLGFAAASFLLAARLRLLFFAAIAVALVPAYIVNPLSQGIGPIVENPLYEVVKSINAAAPKARWAAIGNNILPNFLIATGADVVNGDKYTPNLDFFRRFDPEGSSEDIYNRYANLSIFESRPEQKLPLFELFQWNMSILRVAPCDEKLREEGITHYAFSYRPSAESVSCMQLLKEFPESDIYLFERQLE